MGYCATPTGPGRYGSRPDCAALQLLQTARQLNTSADLWVLRGEEKPGPREVAYSPKEAIGPGY